MELHQPVKVSSVYPLLNNICVLNAYEIFSEITCLGLGDTFVNGTIIYSVDDNPENTSFIFGTIAIHECIQGFYLSGEEERICVDGHGTTGQWNGSTPTCES